MKAFTFHQFAMVCLAAATAIGQQVQPNATQQPGAQNPPAAQQERQQERQQDRQQQNREQTQSREGRHDASLESALADCFITGNQHEIALLKMGMEKSQNEQIKQAAQKMIQDHEQAIEKLAKYASKSHAGQSDPQARSAAPADGQPRTEGATPGRTFDAPAQARQAQATPGQPNTQPTQPNQAANQADRPEAGNIAQSGRVTQRANRPISTDTSSDGVIAQLQRVEEQAAEECLRLTKEELQKHEGKDFDSAFVGQQLGMHLGMLAKLSAAEKNTSGEFQSVVQECHQKTMEHKQHLDGLMTQLKSEKDGGASQPRNAEGARTNPAQPRSNQPRQQ